MILVLILMYIDIGGDVDVDFGVDNGVGADVVDGVGVDVDVGVGDGLVLMAFLLMLTWMLMVMLIAADVGFVEWGTGGREESRKL